MSVGWPPQGGWPPEGPLDGRQCYVCRDKFVINPHTALQKSKYIQIGGYVTGIAQGTLTTELLPQNCDRFTPSPIKTE